MTGADWVDTWAAVPQPTEPDHLPPPPFTRDNVGFAGATLRQTVRVSIGGQRLRLRLSNAFGSTPLPITAVSVALPLHGRAGVPAIRPGTSRWVTFGGGHPSAVVPPLTEAESDPLEVDLPAGSNLTVTMHLADGQPSGDITSHPGSRTTSHLLAGDHVCDPDLPGATPVEHWYFISGVRVPARATTAAAVLVGDSLTDGRGSTTNRNDRWPDRLFDRFQSRPETSDIAVLSHAVGGSRLLDDGQGPGCLERLIRDVLARDTLRWLVVFKGINDLGAAGASRPVQTRLADDLVSAYDQIITGLHRRGVRVLGASLLPFGGHTEYDDPHGHRERARRSVNEWIRSGGRFDGVLDFDRAVRDPSRPHRLLPAFDSGDHLHLNPTGYRALADAVPADLFLPV